MIDDPKIVRVAVHVDTLASLLYRVLYRGVPIVTLLVLNRFMYNPNANIFKAHPYQFKIGTHHAPLIFDLVLPPGAGAPGVK